MKNRTEQNKKLFLETVKLTRGNISHACKALSLKKGFHRATIYKWIVKDSTFNTELNTLLLSMGKDLSLIHI